MTLLDPANAFPGDTARGVSADGKVVVGDAEIVNTHDPIAFRWGAEQGMESVQKWLATSGVNTTGWQLQTARATSADGGTVVGGGIDPAGLREAYIAVVPARPDPTDNPGTPTPSDGVLGVDNFTRSLASLSAWVAAPITSVAHFPA